MGTKKRDIESAAINGLSLDGADVARVTRGRGGSVVTLRHVWPESVDGRVWAGVKRAALALCRQQAARTGGSVELYAVDGTMLECVEASS